MTDELARTGHLRERKSSARGCLWGARPGNHVIPWTYARPSGEGASQPVDASRADTWRNAGFTRSYLEHPCSAHRHRTSMGQGRTSRRLYTLTYNLASTLRRAHPAISRGPTTGRSRGTWRGRREPRQPRRNLVLKNRWAPSRSWRRAAGLRDARPRGCPEARTTGAESTLRASRSAGSSVQRTTKLAERCRRVHSAKTRNCPPQKNVPRCRTGLAPRRLSS